MSITVKFQGNQPIKATEGSAGFDLVANEDCIIPKNSYRLVSTGLKIKLPQGYEAQVRGRSGLALKYGITVLNSPGTIDSDYTGEVGVILHNCGTCDFQVMSGDRVAQLVIQKLPDVVFEHDIIEDDTERGSQGFGSTGV